MKGKISQLAFKTEGKDEWLTPPHIITSLGEFDLDPCAPINRPWDTAKTHYTTEDDGLSKNWQGRVWLNPPYGNETAKWLSKMAEHKNGVTLIFARTETIMFFKYIWDKADAILFIKGRINFYHVDGTKGKYSGGAPSCLVAYGRDNVNALSESGIVGQFVFINHQVAQTRQMELF